MRRNPLRLFVALILITAFAGTTTFACGPFTLEAIFVYTVHPVFPLEQFAKGEIGVVQPSYARSYLYVAYRHLNGVHFTPQEQKALTSLWKDRLETTWDLGDQEWIKAWQTARQKVAGLPEAPKIEVYRNREKPNEYDTYLNCQKDAFDGAISTLDARIQKYGVDSPIVRDWVQAQDQVFSNCNEGQRIPAPASGDALVQADRAYQIAAANFYSNNWDEARRDFEKIAADNGSPWHSIAPYLIARTLLRKASLGAPDTKTDSLTQAEAQLNKILADNNLSASHSAATRLMDLVRLRLHPAERLHELAHALLVKDQNEKLKQLLWDYTVLLNTFMEDDSGENKATPDDVVHGDDLSDWIATMQSTSNDSLDHALAKWAAGHSEAWFVAALSKAGPKSPKVTELINAALNVRPGSPAFASAHFHAVRLLIATGKKAEARQQLDQLLKSNRSQFDVSSLNLLRGQRMLLATTLADFLTYAPRVPSGLSWNDDGREVPAESSELSDENKAVAGKPLFDFDAVNSLNQQFPLTLLSEAAKSSTLPPNLRRDLTQATWLRAVMLGDYTTADDLVPTLKAVLPDISRLLDDYTSATDPDAKRFAAIFAWLRFPGLEPVVDQGVGRDTPLNKQDIYRDNWWCGAAFTPTPETQEEEKKTPSFTSDANGAPEFLSAAERGAGRREYAALRALGAAPNYLSQQVVQWATKHPDDPRAPEALHLAVNSTRHGCTDAQTGRWSKAAFDLLHRKYPNSSWAKKTPYWFKD